MIMTKNREQAKKTKSPVDVSKPVKEEEARAGVDTRISIKIGSIKGRK